VKNTRLSQVPSPDQSDRAAAAPRKSTGSAKGSRSTLLPPVITRLGVVANKAAVFGDIADGYPKRALFVVGIAASVLIGGVGAGSNEAEASKTQAEVTPVGHVRTTSSGGALPVETSKFVVQRVDQELLSQRIAQVEGITIEAEMPRDVGGSLNTDVIFVFEANSDGEWKEQPVADIVVGDAITYLPPPEAKTLGFVAGEATAAIDLEPGFAGRICLKVDTSSRSDFLWALGHRRSTTITGIKPELTDEATCSAYFASENRSRGAASRVYARLNPAG
jgi:hypothetical protein